MHYFYYSCPDCKYGADRLTDGRTVLPRWCEGCGKLTKFQIDEYQLRNWKQQKELHSQAI